LSHDQLNVLRFKTAIVHFLIIIIVFLSLLVLYRLAFAVLGTVVMAGVIDVGGFRGGELLCGSCLVLRVEIFNLGFAENTEPKLDSFN
jgi:hypothetical protein